ncbi:DUF2147 domain-containing protein [Nibrella saemangeumensis]|uniref:DUF2147 domain-containing protein n=1 Tax=Nibrella saemangeumensis TaxID=1084526 RepID=A0ABP8MQX7_9BACT
MNVLRYSLWMLLILVFSTGFAPEANHSDAVVGTWLSARKKNQVQVYKRGDRYFGRLVWMQDSHDPATQRPKVDLKNPNEKLRNRPLLNLDIMTNFTFEGENVWGNGQIYNPEDGRTYSCELLLKDPNTLHIRGYLMGMSFLGKTSVWTRVR